MFKLFDHTEKRVFYVRTSPDANYRHQFGGKAIDLGFQFRGGPGPLHLICTFDTNDPDFPIRTNLRLYPFCFGFLFEGENVAYRVNGPYIDVLFPIESKLNRDFPYEGYPQYYRSMEVSLEAIPYDPFNAEDALRYAAILGLAHVPDDTLTQVANMMDEWKGWENVDLEGMTREEHLAKYSTDYPLFQGQPDTRCVYEQCPQYGIKGAMETIAMDEADNRFDEGTNDLWNDEYTQTLFQRCTHCGTIYASNQCT